MSIKKYLSLEKAQKLVPEVRRKILKIMKINKAIELLCEIEIFCDDDAEAIYRDIRFNKKFHQLSHKLFLEMENLTEKGAVLNNLENGIVNFYSMQDKSPIFLCWKMGDKHIKYWHGVDEDFSERKPISKLFDLDKTIF